MSVTQGTIVPRKRRFDPDRRERITQAALRVISTVGVERMTIRNVAAEADVPLGSMTYHFASVDELLDSAMTTVAMTSVARWQKWSADLVPGSDVCEALADLMIDMTDGDTRSHATLELELYIAAARREHLRLMADEWSVHSYEVLLNHVDVESARMMSIIINGAVIEAVSSGNPLERDELITMFRKACRTG